VILLVDAFLLAVNITMAIYAFIASIVFWFSWRKRPDFIYMFIAVIIYTIGHSLLIIKHYSDLFSPIGNGIILIALLVVVISSLIEYHKLMVVNKKEKIVFWITIAFIFIFGGVSIVILNAIGYLTTVNALMMAMIILLVPSTIFILRVYLKQQTITRLFIFFAFIAATLTCISTILATYFDWGLSLNIALNFIFQTFILTGGLAAIAEQKITASEEKYRNLSEHLEEKVAERTQQLENLNKELEAFSYSVSHDLRTPLRSIAGFTKILKDEYDLQLGEDGIEHLNRILKNTNRMNELINDMLDLAQISRVDFIIESVNLNQIANDVMNNLKLLYPDREIKFVVDESLNAQGDSKLLKIVFENLFSNAIKFSKTKPKTIIRFGTTENRGRKVFFIEDNGIGFDMKYYEKLFGLFQRLHSNSQYEGTGIGLITVKRIIERHKGEIWAESEPNKGTTFYFTLAGK
jgi:signal transduction histidine kinase